MSTDDKKVNFFHQMDPIQAYDLSECRLEVQGYIVSDFQL